ncbi:Glucose 1-dehydrogenase [Piscirickettsia salmonis]|uniref:Glucose 1-dehydrogenase n=1 Tax=Piscirickettsia salmonis TaxID=1238 RepID=A0A9Q6LLE5_PISSA|nr:SDR family oxidoreductase [Piscirickettsia salmonis]QGN94118.1 Glucose 1-dehydrogenase [Piscirickettsia salmonis]QGO06932.1 Glucose 1-dehydrogenase [Piscirickettsia salmonis]QGO35259.1 Glucose 1-dehydrogenase [Piscirickettsia salmonis]QGO38877.1 Glucose 1-dehydrogenase [Piscirickettsia salmonis]QGO42492.1 Glucose 1-dehydrogenase [Piscirickettsia salmonis]
MKKVVIITGSSQGIGAATALKAAAAGYQVCVNYLQNKPAALAIVHAIKKLGQEAIAVQADVSVEEDVVRLFTEVDERLGELKALVNNAGVLDQAMPVEKMTAARINRMLTTNVTSYFLCAREAVKRMSTAHGGNGGAIVNVSSAAARLGSVHEYVDYAASKGAIDTMTVGLAKEVATLGIRVNAVRPGFIYTQLHASSGDPDRVDRLKAQLPMQRGGTVEEVANAIFWLLSEQASYSSGSFIDVAGGC